MRFLREQLRLSQGEFGRKLGIPPQNVSRYEGGHRLPSAETLIRLHAEFGVDIQWLLTGQGSMPSESKKGLSPEIQEIVEWAMASEGFRSVLLYIKEDKMRPFIQQHAPHLLAELKRNAG